MIGGSVEDGFFGNYNKSSYQRYLCDLVIYNQIFTIDLRKIFDGYQRIEPVTLRIKTLNLTTQL